MRVSRAELAAGATLLLVLASPALAQIGPPVPLAPATPQDQSPAQQATPPAPEAAPDSTPSDNDIQATPLAPLDPSWIGTLGPADGALPRTMWAGTPRSFVAAALPLLQPTSSPSLQDLERRLLSSDAIAPVGQDQAGHPGLAELRLDRLLALGRVDALPLLDALPQANRSETFDRDNVELRFAANDVAHACSQVQDRAPRYANAWWDRAIIACQALSGAYDQAALGLSAMRERKVGADPAFEALIDTINGHRQKLDKLSDPTPMRVVLLAAANLPLPADALASAGPSALAAWATNDKVPAILQLAAAEKAESFGALPPDALGLLYGSIDAKPDEMSAALKSGKLPDDAHGRALLYDLARTNNTAATRVAALTLLLADARRRDAFVAMAQLIAPLVAELQPAPEQQGFAGDAARVLLAAGLVDQAEPWIALANSPELLVIADLARSPTSEDNRSPLPEAVPVLASRNAAAATRQIDLLAGLLSALGEPLGPLDFAPLLQATHPGVLPGGALWLDQRQAAAARRVGETVLASLLIAASGDHLSLEPVVLAQVVAGLRAVGLDADARALAVEAALAAGV